MGVETRSAARAAGAHRGRRRSRRQYLLPVLLTSLRVVGECQWKELFESVSIVDSILSRDPAGAYSRMDYASRDYYRTLIAELAHNSEKSEVQVSEAAIALAAEAAQERRERHVGFWLLDHGLERLRSVVGYRAPFRRRVLDFILRWPQSFYLIGIEVLTLLVVGALLEWPQSVIPTLAALFLLVIPATQAAVDFINNLTGYLAPLVSCRSSISAKAYRRIVPRWWRSPLCC